MNDLALNRAWTDERPHPWRRLVARLLDYLLFGQATLVLLAVGLATLAPEAFEGALAWLSGLSLGLAFLGPVLLVLLAAPGMALCLGLTGGTPGKWLAGVRIETQDGKAIGVGPALAREAWAGGVGFAAGLPVFCVAFAWQAGEYLAERGRTTWDEDGGWRVVHRPDGATQVLLMSGGTAVLAVVQVSAWASALLSLWG